MNHGLAIRDSASVDFVWLGTLVHRLDSGIVPFRKAHECQIHVSGGEFNVAANLSDCSVCGPALLPQWSSILIGDLVAERVRAMGVTPCYKMFQHNGATGPNIASVSSDRTYGARVFCNRANEVAAQLNSGDTDWNAIFAPGVRWFHSGGIFGALSDTTPELIIEGMQAARNAGAVVSFDLNFREKLWNLSGGQKRARQVIGRILEKRRRSRRPRTGSAKGVWNCRPGGSCDIKTRPARFPAMIDRVLERYPHIKIIATTLREVHSTNRHGWGAVAWINAQTCMSPLV
jgi:2-dehydro-3-deoxygluconokinase